MSIVYVNFYNMIWDQIRASCFVKKVINSLKLSCLFSFLNKVRNSFVKFSTKPLPQKLLRNGGKFKSRNASHSNLTI